jgi:hypothetical protein
LKSDNKIYVFPLDKIYFSWFNDFSQVQTISDQELASYPIGGNVIFKAGEFLKIVSDPKVYLVTDGGILRWITSEAIAEDLSPHKENWNKYVIDVPDVIFTDYIIGEDIK